MNRSRSDRLGWRERVWAALSGARRGIRRGLGLLIGKLFLMLHKRHVIHDVTVVLSDPGADPEQYLSSIRAALELLHEVDPRRFRVLHRSVKHILVWPGSYTAYDTWGGIHLAARHVPGVPAPILASALVHEATHLRVAKRGIRYIPDLRSRIEALCVQEQAAFLRKVPPDGPGWAKQVELGLKEPWWNEADRRARVQRCLQDAGLPGWIEPLLYRPEH